MCHLFFFSSMNVSLKKTLNLAGQSLFKLFPLSSAVGVMLPAVSLICECAAVLNRSKHGKEVGCQ